MDKWKEGIFIDNRIKKRKNKRFSIMLVIVVMVITFCYFENNKGDIVKVSSNSLTIKTIKSRESVKYLKSIYENIVYENTIEGSMLDKDSNEYKMWLESNHNEERIFNISFWIIKDDIYVFNKIDNKYGYINEDDKIKFIEILKKYIDIK